MWQLSPVRWNFACAVGYRPPLASWQVTFIAGGLLVGGSRGFPAPGEAGELFADSYNTLIRARIACRAGDNSKALSLYDEILEGMRDKLVPTHLNPGR
jgi:hypothetical protein